MRLKTAEQFQKAEKYKDAFFKTNENQKKAHKNLRKMARREEIDEYDPKYYGFA